MLLKRDALHWYELDVRFSVELMRSFVQGVEELVTDSILKYQTTKSEGGHQGLDEDNFPLKEIFEEHFPNLQRRSALLTVWSLFEHELDRLCALYKSEKVFGIAASDLHGAGIDRSTAYLEKVARLGALKDSQEWSYLKSVQEIRNTIAHAGGKIQDHEGKPKKKTVVAMKNLGLSGNDEIVVPQDFLSKLVDGCDRYFQLIDAAVAAKEKPSSAKQ